MRHRSFISLGFCVALLALVMAAACNGEPVLDGDGTVDAGASGAPLIYGDDNLIEAYEAAGHPLVSLFESDVVLLESNLVVETERGNPAAGYDIDFTVYGTYEEYMASIGEPLCEGEEPTRRNQPVPGFCSGFVVGRDLIATAGHCIANSSDCADTVFVFGFVMRDAATPVSHVGQDDVYRCAEIVSRIDDGSNDYGLIRTDRDLVGRPALPVRRSGAVEDLASGSDELTVVGHPMGMPAKIADGASPQGGTADYFTANVDVYGGNSGSAVVNVDGVVEGILVRGNPDHLFEGGCWVLNWCPDTGCTGAAGSGFEEITRITNLSGLIPFACGDGVCDPGQTCIDCPSDCGACGAEVELFFDDFSNDLVQWTETGVGAWTTEPLHSTNGYPTAASGEPAAHASNCDAGCAIEVAEPIDLTPYDAAVLTFLRFVDTTLDNGETLTVLAWNGSGWDVLFTWTNGDGDDNSWHAETVDLSPYLGVSDFRLAFEASMSDRREHVQVDDVRIVGASATGTCGPGVECDDGLFCNGVETCDDAGSCVPGTAPALDDGVDCTVDVCNEETDTVLHTPDHALCDNGLFCDGAEVCDAVLGCQPGVAPIVDDGVDCTLDACDEEADVVAHVPDDGLCDNGLFCDGSESCDPISGCQPGSISELDDGVGCTDDLCDEATDFVVHVANDARCDNGLFCDGAEVCDPEVGCRAGVAPELSDGVDCTADVCDEAADRVDHTADDGRCDDGLFCNGAETCDESLGCQAGAPPELSDGVACTMDTCDEEADAVDHVPDDGLCDDGLYCNGVETCDESLGCEAGVPPELSDGVACTVDSCDEEADTVDHTPDDRSCSDGDFCDGAEVCDPSLGCLPGEPPALAGDSFCGDTSPQVAPVDGEETSSPSPAGCSVGGGGSGSGPSLLMFFSLLVWIGRGRRAEKAPCSR